MDDEMRRRRAARAKKRRQQVMIMRLIMIVLCLVVVLMAALVAKDMMGKDKKPKPQETNEQGEPLETDELQETETETEPVTEAPASLIEQADLLAAQYDYDAAIALLKGTEGYASDTTMQAKVTEYEATKATCVEYPLDQVTHIFYHTLVYDTAKAFDGDPTTPGYNQVMTTVDEFNKITQSMYDKGYVLVSLHDMCTVNEDGTVTPGKIMLPPGKKAFVLSQDDVSYYHYMDGDGMATKLVLDETGSVKNEYKNDDGTVSIGDYDMVPLIDTFVDQHPDFSYRGSKGILALTGYNGVLGYRTDIAYKTRENLDPDQVKFFEENPDFNEESWKKECEEATKVADAMKADGWEFASHTWGHRNATEYSAESLAIDDGKWQENVANIVGKTDVIIFAFGADIGSWEGYSADNPKFQYFKNAGYNIYCNVDAAPAWVQFGSNYMRQGRRNLDGYRMYYFPEQVADLFDVSTVFDPARPTPVPGM